MQTALILNLGMAVLALALGEHLLLDALEGQADAVSRARAWELTAQVHVAIALSALALQSLGVFRWFVAVPLLLGLVSFSGALFAYGAVGLKWAMPGTGLGAVLIALGFLAAAVVSARR